MKTAYQLFLAFFFFSSTLFAQDTVYFKNGSSLEGKVSIQYSTGNDLVEIGGKVYPAAEIDSVHIAGTRTLFTKRVVYYHTERRLELVKSVLVEQVLTGSVKLYKYTGTGFDLVVQKGNQVYVLQKIPNNAVLDQMMDYKSVLLTVFGNKVDREEVFKLNLNENSVVHITNNYNTQLDSNYVKTVKSKHKHREFAMNFSVGQIHSWLDYSGDLKVTTVGGFPYTEKHSLKNIHSGKITYIFTIEKNFSNSSNWFYTIGSGFNDFEFNLMTNDYNRVLKLESYELYVRLGVNYRRKILVNKLYQDLGLGFYGWMTSWKYSGERNYHWLVPQEAIHKKGLGYYFQYKLNYYLTDNIGVFLNVQSLLRFKKKYYTYNSADYSWLDADDKLQVLLLTTGIKFYFIRDGIF